MDRARILPFHFGVGLAILVLAAGAGTAGAAVVINEILYEPLMRTEHTEFVELHNTGSVTVDLGGWQLDEGLAYTFPAATFLGAGQWIIVAENPAALEAIYGIDNSLGPWQGQLEDRDEVILRRPDGDVEDRVAYRLGFPWPTDTQGRSIELIHPALDNDLAGSWRVARPATSPIPSPSTRAATPGRINSVWSQVCPPQIRQVDHTPLKPGTGQSVTVTAKVTDPEGIAAVQLHYQIVQPGQYLPARLPLSSAELQSNGTQPRTLNPAFEDPANWHEVPMVDNGLYGDAEADDHIFTGILPAQIHRTLVRYRIQATDTLEQAVTVPYPDDAGRNFACWFYDGIPPYRADIRGVSGDPRTYGADVMTALPAYHLLTRAEDLQQCLAYELDDPIADLDHPGRTAYNWEGALIYEGRVYDHVEYRPRSVQGRYHRQGKRDMKFRFARGHAFAARNRSGKAYDPPWQTLNVGKCIDSPPDANNARTGHFGLPDVVNSILYNLMSVPAPHAHWFQLRVVDDTEEAPDPYRGDFWGLFVALEETDETFVQGHNLPEGNLYRPPPGDSQTTAQLCYQGRDSVADGSDYLRLRQALNSNPDVAELDELMNIDQIFRYLAVNTATGDTGPSEGAYTDRQAVHFFQGPLPDNPLGQLWYLPGDSAASWRFLSHPGCYESWQALGGDCQLAIEDTDAPNPVRRQFRNTLREFRDLLWNRETLEPLLEELAAQVALLAEADRDRWTTVPGGAEDTGDQNALTDSIWDTVERMKAFAWGGHEDEPGTNMSDILDALSEQEGDAGSIPATPIIAYEGLQGHPIDDLRFSASRFQDPQGDHTFAAMRWRVAEVLDPVQGPFEIEGTWESGDITAASADILVPGRNLKIGRRYRARVRVQDNTARWSHWSAPLEFTAGPPADTRLLDSLRITEIMYHPADPPLGHPDAEFIEIANLGPNALSLAGVRLDRAIEYTFADEVLAPGQHIILVQNVDIFEAIYGTGLPLVGAYNGRLNNNRDTLQVIDPYDQVLLEFEYQDGWYPLTDGQGFSLVPDPAAGDPDNRSVKTAWQPSHQMDGSPGWPEAAEVPADGSILINEVLAHSHDADPDWAELHNTTDQALHIGGWFLSDSINERTKYEIATGTTIPPYGYVVFYEDLHFGNVLASGTRSPFALSDDGETLYLTSGYRGEPTSYQEREAFGASETGISFGRWEKSTGTVNFIPLAHVTPGAENAGPLVGPLVINEIMYNPAGDEDAEYVEILNISQQPVLLYDSLRQESWRLTDDPDNPSIDLQWTGPQDIVIQPEQTALLTKDLSALLSHFSIAPGTQVFAWPKGGLNNGGEKLQLSKAGELENGQRYWIRVDRVVYTDEYPWPTRADGDGSALQRRDAQAYGNDPANWQALAPSPGQR